MEDWQKPYLQKPAIDSTGFNDIILKTKRVAIATLFYLF